MPRAAKKICLLLTAFFFFYTGYTPSAAAATFAGGEKASLLLLNAYVYTADAERSVAQAVAISGDTILFAGSSTDAKLYMDRKTKVLDLAGKLVLPGFIDTRPALERELALFMPRAGHNAGVAEYAAALEALEKTLLSQGVTTLTAETAHPQLLAAVKYGVEQKRLVLMYQLIFPLGPMEGASLLSSAEGLERALSQVRMVASAMGSTARAQVSGVSWALPDSFASPVAAAGMESRSGVTGEAYAQETLQAVHRLNALLARAGWRSFIAAPGGPGAGLLVTAAEQALAGGGPWPVTVLTRLPHPAPLSGLALAERMAAWGGMVLVQPLAAADPQATQDPYAPQGVRPVHSLFNSAGGQPLRVAASSGVYSVGGRRAGADPGPGPEGTEGAEGPVDSGPHSPLEAIQAGVMRPLYDAGGSVTAQRPDGTSRVNMVDAFTCNAAAMLGLEKTLGSIERGKTANLVIMGSNFLHEARVSDAQIRDSMVVGTIVSGVLRFAPGSL